MTISDDIDRQCNRCEMVDWDVKGRTVYCGYCGLESGTITFHDSVTLLDKLSVGNGDSNGD